MATQQDCSIGVVAESTYGTGVTVTRFPEFTTETFDWAPNRVQGKGLRVGGRVARSARRVTTTVAGSGGFEMEAVSKGMGVLFDFALGASTSSTVTASTYQQVFTLGDTPDSFTAQVGLPRVDGTVDAYTYLGCMVEQLEIDFSNGEILVAKFDLNIRDLTTATSYATPSYASSPTLFHFAGGSVYSGTLTEPTTSSLASGTTTLSNVRGGSVTLKNNLQDRYNLGADGKKTKPVVGLREITGSLEMEYDSTTFRDALINDTEMALVLTFETDVALDTGVETLQVVIPAVKFDSELPKSNGGELITHTMSFVGLDNLTATEPIWVVARTADTAI